VSLTAYTPVNIIIVVIKLRRAAEKMPPSKKGTNKIRSTIETRKYKNLFLFLFGCVIKRLIWFDSLLYTWSKIMF
jgi:hypothetical protein